MTALDRWVASCLAEELQAQCSEETRLFSFPLVGIIINNPWAHYSSDLSRAKECVAAFRVYAEPTLKKFDNLMYLDKLSKKSKYDGKLEELAVMFIRVLETGIPEFHQYLDVFRDAIECKSVALTPSETKNALICCLIQHHFKVKIGLIKCKVYLKSSDSMVIENAAFNTLLDNIMGWLTKVDKTPVNNIKAVIDAIIENIYELKHRFAATKMQFYLMQLEIGIMCQQEKLKVLSSPAKKVIYPDPKSMDEKSKENLGRKLETAKAALALETQKKLMPAMAAATAATAAGPPVSPVVFKPAGSGVAKNIKASNSSLSLTSQSSTSTDSTNPEPHLVRSSASQTADCNVGSSFCSESSSMSSLPAYSV